MFWRHAGLRSAGFPSDLVLGFAAPECAAAADELAAARHSANAAWRAVSSQLHDVVRRLRHRLRSPATDSAEAATLRATLRQVDRLLNAKTQAAQSATLSQFVDETSIRGLDAATRRVADAIEAFASAYAAATTRLDSYAVRLVGNEQFREAVTWQNLAALDSFDRLPSGKEGYKARRTRALIASYAQRYATKNDTIGFFGPMSWASLGRPGNGLRVLHGRSFLSHRSVYFEEWPIRALAKKLSEDPRMRAWLTPRRLPHVHVEGRFLVLPGNARIALTADETAVLSLCNGSLKSRDLANAVLANPFLGFSCEDDVFDQLSRMVADRRIGWGFETQTTNVYPERVLHSQIERIHDPALRRAVVHRLDALDNARAEVARAAGNSKSLAQAISDLNKVFEHETGMPSTRRHGETYGARTLVYEDCRRGLDVEVAADLLEELSRPLGLVLDSARWFCHQVSLRIREELRAAFNRLISAPSSAGAALTDLPTYWLAVQGLFFGERPLDIDDLAQDLVNRWQRVLGLSAATAHRLHSSSEQLLQDSRNSFPAPPHCGWRTACHQSPDVMIAAKDEDAIRDGAFVFVMGELHVATNALGANWVVQHHSSPDDLLSWLRADLGGERIIPILSAEGAGRPIRVQAATRGGQDREICFSHDASPQDPDRALMIGDLVVQSEGGGLVVQTRDGRLSFDVMDVFSEFASAFAVNRFRMFAGRPHTPRIQIDKLVVQRESWRIACGDIAGASVAEDAQAFLEARQWARSLGIPRWSFVKLPWEAKPFYLDFESPIYVRMLLQQIRSALERGIGTSTQVTVTEMLPSHGDAWLCDPTGQHFTSEFRIVAIHEEDGLGRSQQAA
jgi:hypothetical protein